MRYVVFLALFVSGVLFAEQEAWLLTEIDDAQSQKSCTDLGGQEYWVSPWRQVRVRIAEWKPLENKPCYLWYYPSDILFSLKNVFKHDFNAESTAECFKWIGQDTTIDRSYTCTPHYAIYYHSSGVCRLYFRTWKKVSQGGGDTNTGEIPVYKRRWLLNEVNFYMTDLRLDKLNGKLQGNISQSIRIGEDLRGHLEDWVDGGFVDVTELHSLFRQLRQNNPSGGNFSGLSKMWAKVFQS